MQWIALGIAVVAVPVVFYYNFGLTLRDLGRIFKLRQRSV